MRGQIPGIVLCSLDEARLPASENRQADHIQPWRIDDAAVVPQLHLSRRGPARPASGSRGGTRSPRQWSGPRRCADRAGAAIGRHAGRLEALPVRRPRHRAIGLGPTRRRCRAGAPSSDRPARSDCAGRRRTAPCRRESSDSRADELDALRGQRVQVERRACRRPDQLRRRQPPRTRQVVDLVVALVPHPAASIHQSTSRPRYVRGSRTCSPTDRTTRRPDRWISSASCTPVAEAPTTSTPPFGQAGGIAVLERCDVFDRRTASNRGSGGTRRDVARAGGEDDRAAFDLAAAGRHAITACRSVSRR